jgi:hypothetical protein
VPAMNRPRRTTARTFRCALATMALASLAGSAGCKPKASGAQCEQLLERYAELVVTERFADAGPEQIKSEREREKREARGDDAFKNCSSEVSQTELDCAMHAASADAVEKCLE